jgi:hypothetical protein
MEYAGLLEKVPKRNQHKVKYNVELVEIVTYM